MKQMLLAICVLIFVLRLNAQDFAPSQQAQGYLDSKNVTVDYATGLFHYKVPVYTLKSGDFELPVSLNYVGKGVKREDVPGLIGYNWTLNTGGVVTRTIRGGMADEEPEGYIYQNFNDPPTAAQVEAVNKREVDGESDIFTASFNGQSVHFMIKKEGNNVIAEPLERTNVKIECEKNNNYLFPIDGWIITDENGNKYYFRQKEWSADIVKEDAVSFNGIRGKSYVSSWYINKIEPRNCEPIIYNYQQNKLNKIKYRYWYESLYDYGRAMSTRPFNFMKYKYRFDRDIKQAESYLGGYSLELKLENNLYELVNGYAIRNPDFEAISRNIQANYRIMGQLADWVGLGKVSSDVISTLDQWISTFSNIGSHKAGMAVQCLMSAKHTMIQCFDEVEYITTQKIGSGSLMTMKSPILDNISCKNNKMKFYYQKANRGEQYMLKSMRVEDVTNNCILEAQLNGRDGFKELNFIGKDSVKFNRIKFDYYGSAGPYDYDIWGFPKRRRPDYTDYNFLENTDAEYSKINSLSKITNINKGEIVIDYESNVIPYCVVTDEYAFNVGGIRVKSVFIKDVLMNKTDTIKYIYPYPGELVFEKFFSSETIDYGDFFDRIRQSRVKTEGNAFLNTGNNGVYYSYVEEEFVGKGKKTYLFYNPARFLLPSESFYKFWLNGLPLGSAVYDSNGNLKSVTKNYYQGEVEFADFIRYNEDVEHVYYEGNWFIDFVHPIAYDKTKSQVKAYEYYMDVGRLSPYYRNQSNIFLYQDGSILHYLNPYNSIYLPNIAPRTTVVSPEQTWVLKYGGNILLKSQEEYRIESNYSTASSILHFVATDLGVPFNKTEYFYDNLENFVTPTRINRTDARGDVYTSAIKRVCDMNVSGTIMDMKSENIFSPIVKQQELKNNKLLKETVNIYGSLSTNDRKYFGITKQQTYIPGDNMTITSFVAVDNNLFSYAEQNYTLERSIDYINNNNVYVPVSVTRKSDTLLYCYDFTVDAPILEATGYTNRCIFASNLITHNLMYDVTAVYYVDYYYDNIVSAFNVLNDIEQQDLHQIEIEYIRSSRYLTIKKAMEAIVTKGQSLEYPEFKDCIDSISLHIPWKHEFLGLCTNGDINSYDVISDFFLMISNQLFSEAFYSTLQRCDLIKKEFSVDVTSAAELKLYLLLQNCRDQINYTITHSGGTSTARVVPTAKSYWNLQVLNLDLSGYTGITSVTIERPSSADIAYIALVPEDCSFEATSYNTDGTVFCKFDQNSQMERYEYDGAGRVVRVFDQNNRLLKANTYNVVLQ